MCQCLNIFFQAAAAAAAAQGEGLEGEGTPEEKEDDGIGLPHVVVDCSDKSTPVPQKVIGCGRFPTMEEVAMLYYSCH